MMRDTSAAGMLPGAGDLVLGRYRVERVVGRGGMGVVLAARHELLDQPVALKLLLPEVMDEDTARRFLNEARNSVRIRSEHVARVMDVGTLDSGIPFILMELLEGRDLGHLLKQNGPLPIPLAVDYCIQALEALSAAHALRIVHRDLKPSNLFISLAPDGTETLKVLDFGISKSAIDTSPDMAQTSTRALLGSPLYISPEQFRSSKNVDPRADMWAMGIILYELLAGSPPFSGDTLGEVFIAILEHPLVPVRVRRPDVPPALDDIVLRCLQRDREARFADVAELARALAPFGARDVRVELARMESNLSRTPAMRGVFPSGPEGQGGALTPVPGYAPGQATPVGGIAPGAATPAPAAAGWSTPPPQVTPAPPPQYGAPPPPRPPAPHGFAQSASAQRTWTATPDARPRRAGIVALALGVLVLLGVAVATTMALVVPRRSAVHPSASASQVAAQDPALPPSADPTAPAAVASVPDPAPPATAVAPSPPPVPAKDDDPPPTRPSKPATSVAVPSRGGTTPAPTSTSILDKRR